MTWRETLMALVETLIALMALTALMALVPLMTRGIDINDNIFLNEVFH